MKHNIKLNKTGGKLLLSSVLALLGLGILQVVDPPSSAPHPHMLAEYIVFSLGCILMGFAAFITTAMIVGQIVDWLENLPD